MSRPRETKSDIAVRLFRAEQRVRKLEIELDAMQIKLGNAKASERLCVACSLGIGYMLGLATQGIIALILKAWR
jgi:hypothetical protein